MFQALRRGKRAVCVARNGYAIIKIVQDISDDSLNWRKA